jgi:hypothetical protein
VAPKIPKVPIHGKTAHNAAFLVSIGNLVVSWANNESVFMAMLQLLLIGGEHSAAIVWHSHRTTQARLELVSRLCRERVKDKQLLEDISQAISIFKGFSRTRHFYCHATYRYDGELNLSSASGVSTTQEGDPLSFEVKRMDLATLNEMKFASIEMGNFNGKLWKLVERLQIELGVQHEVLPLQLREPK